MRHISIPNHKTGQSVEIPLDTLPARSFEPAALPTQGIEVELPLRQAETLELAPAASVAPDAQLAGRELAILRSPLPVDNFEAVAARPASDGSVLIYVLSDDNFSAAERTLLLQFRWRP